MAAVSGRGREAALSLYRSLLRAHAKHLPTEMRQLGDAYVKAEFRSHKNVTNVAHLELFFNEWNSYLEQIQFTAQARGVLSSSSDNSSDANNNNSASVFEFGRDLPSEVELSEDQLAQLEKLKAEVTKVGRSNNR